MSILDTLSPLFQQHIAHKTAQFNTIMDELELDLIIISSGENKLQFADDRAYPFIASPYFREWLPINQRSNCFLVLKKGDKPDLYLHDKEDIWHSLPQGLPEGWEASLKVTFYQELSSLFSPNVLETNRVVFIGPENSLGFKSENYNPEKVSRYIDFLRQQKTPYEQACIRHANELSVLGHQAAKNKFFDNGTELDVKLAFLAASKCNEKSLPYDAIVGINENAAILHHTDSAIAAKTPAKSLLIDAGVSFHCYAADITRSYAYDNKTEFYDLLVAMELLKNNIIEQAAPGVTYAHLNKLTHEGIAILLSDFNIITLSADEIFTKGITKTFMPHSFGHGLGVNVHERGVSLASPKGQLHIKNEFGYENQLLEQQVITVEPGLYFIPTLLKKLAIENDKNINWNKVNKLLSFGGIRVEDNILIKQNSKNENFTLNAFNKTN